MEVAIIGGAGTIGATTGYDLATALPEATVTLIDVRADLAAAQATDIRHARAHLTHGVGRAATDWPRGATTGTVRGLPTDRAEECDPDAVVVAASAPRPDVSAQRGGRIHFLEMNLEVMDDVADQMATWDPVPTVVVTNPLDRMTDRVWRQTGWPRETILGYSLSETARLADELARRFDASPAAVDCPVMGEHGEHIVPVFSRATVRGEPIDLSAADRQAVLDYTRQVPYDVIDVRGAEETSRWVTGRGVSVLVQAILDGGLDEPVCLSTPLAGEYGYEDVCLSVPVRLSGAGVAEILEWDLTADERDRLDAAYADISGDVE